MRTLTTIVLAAAVLAGCARNDYAQCEGDTACIQAVAAEKKAKIEAERRCVSGPGLPKVCW